jgi:hypothetical protein
MTITKQSLAEALRVAYDAAEELGEFELAAGLRLEIARLLGPAADERDTDAIPISDLPLSVRAENILREIHVFNVRDLCQFNRQEIIQLHNVGRVTLLAIEDALGTIGRRLSRERFNGDAFRRKLDDLFTRYARVGDLTVPEVEEGFWRLREQFGQEPAPCGEAIWTARETFQTRRLISPGMLEDIRHVLGK